MVIVGLVIRTIGQELGNRLHTLGIPPPAPTYSRQVLGAYNSLSWVLAMHCPLYCLTHGCKRQVRRKKGIGKGRFGSQGDTKPWFHSWVTVPYPFLLTGPSVGQRPQHDRDPHTLLRSISNTVLCSQGPEAQRRDHRVIPSTRKALEEAWGTARGLSRAPQLCGDPPN